MQSALRWDVTGHTVLDRSTSQSLWGVDFVPIRDADIEPAIIEDLDPDKSGELHGVRSVDGVGYLMQQSSIGDVYAQLIQFKRPCLDYKEDISMNANNEEKKDRIRRKDKTGWILDFWRNILVLSDSFFSEK